MVYSSMQLNQQEHKVKNCNDKVKEHCCVPSLTNPHKHTHADTKRLKKIRLNEIKILDF